MPAKPMVGMIYLFEYSDTIMWEALPPKLLFKTMLQDYSLHEQESKNLIKSYQPISLLSMFIKILERLIFNSMFNYFRQNNLFTGCQSAFISGDSCVTQLLSINHEIYPWSSDCNPMLDIKGVFLDISKAFDKVWHEHLIFKFQSYGIEWSLLRLLKNYLTMRQQRVVLNGQTL